MNKSAVIQEAPAPRFRVGEQVALSRGFGYSYKTGAVYEILALLPPNRTHFQYRIRSNSEAFARVAAENELTPQGAEAAPLQPGGSNG